MKLTDIFPDIPQVERLSVVRVAREDVTSLDTWVWVRSLQGLANRRKPHVYVIGDRQSLYEEHWQNYYAERFGIGSEDIGNPDAFLDGYKAECTGYVLYDMDCLQTMNLAITRCGLEGVLPVAPSEEQWMIRHGIPKRDDLTGRFANDWYAAEWAIDNLWPHCRKKFYANFCIHRPHWFATCHELEDYVVYQRGFALDLPCARMMRRPLTLFRRMLEEGEAPGVMMNWHCAWDQEKEYVAEGAQKGYMALCSFRSPNLTIHGGIGDSEKPFTQPMPAPEEVHAERSKVYVCFYNSDGDATWATNNLQSGNWLVPNRGKFKFGWGILPTTVKLAPGMIQYYHETRSENDCFWGPSSGAAYTYSHLWPKDKVDWYLTESRRLLTQAGENGCNMVNWHLQDWWREAEVDEAVEREQRLLSPAPGMVCGLGGSPYAKSYLDADMPKVHSVGIVNVGRNNLQSIIQTAKECPTRPLFMFLFAQINTGVWEQIESELDAFADHPEIVMLSMDEFLLTLQDAIRQGLLKDTLYEITDDLAERTLKAPGRHRLPICEHVTRELADTADTPPEERRKRLAEAGWSELVSREVEGVARDRDRFRAEFKGRAPFTAEEEADAFLYVGFTVAWTLIRAVITSQGIYANHRTQCLEDFRQLCGEDIDMTPFDGLFTAWENWENGAPDAETVLGWCRALAPAARSLRDMFGPEESEAAFTNWPPRTI